MPEAGTTEPSVLFFVRVAAEAFILDSDISLFSFPLLIFFDLTSHTGIHVAHHIVKLFFFDARWT
jgi:hypothetical protein